MKLQRLRIIGGGLSGLACAVAATQAGLAVDLHEAAPHAGGRCRSYFDRKLGRTIDTGSHLVLAANMALRDYVESIGASDQLITGDAAYPFVDLSDETRWTIRPNRGPVPWWIALPGRRVPGSRVRDYLPLLRLARARSDETVAQRLGGRSDAVYRRLLEPLSTAVLNTEPETASARLLGAVVSETLGRGGRAMAPLFAPNGLSAALVDPALRWLRDRGAALHLADPVQKVESDGTRVTALQFRSGRCPVSPGDGVVLSVPPAEAHRLMPSLIPPLALRPIVNVHYVLPEDMLPDGGSPLLGVVGGAAQWLFCRGDVASVTVSAASDWVDMATPALAGRLWRDVARALGHPEIPLPRWTVVKERRATLAHSPGQELLRPAPKTPLSNLWLSGDWTATGLPCTLEGAVRSGRLAAGLACDAAATGTAARAL